VKGEASSRRGRLAVKLTARMPTRLLANPERVLLNVGIVLLGVIALLPNETGSSPVLAVWPRWFEVEWGLAMVVGGSAALHGYWSGYRPTERLGTATIALGCLLYSIQAIVAPGTRGAVAGAIFLVIALAKTIRLLRSLAVDERIAQHQDRHDLDFEDG
jgi:hypothetical protein